MHTPIHPRRSHTPRHSQEASPKQNKKPRQDTKPIQDKKLRQNKKPRKDQKPSRDKKSYTKSREAKTVARSRTSQAKNQVNGIGMSSRNIQVKPTTASPTSILINLWLITFNRMLRNDQDSFSRPIHKTPTTMGTEDNQ